MGDAHLSTLADEGLGELQALIGSARAILAVYANENIATPVDKGKHGGGANEDEVILIDKGKHLGGGVEDDVILIDDGDDAEGSPPPKGDPVLAGFISARERYLASSRNLRRIIKAIQEREVLDHVKPELAKDGEEEEEVKRVRERVEELRGRVRQRNQGIKLLMDELITLLDDLNMADNWAVLSQK